MCQRVDPAQRSNIKNTIRVVGIDNTRDHKIKQTVALFDLIMHYPHRFILGQHILRIIVKINLRKLRDKKHHPNQGHDHNQPWIFDAEKSHFQTFHSLFSL